MTDYKKVPIKRFPAVAGRKTPEYRYWKKFKNAILVKEHATINAIHFSPVAPYEFAVTCSTRVQIYSSISNAIHRSISRFKDIAYSGSIRNDGNLLVAGDASGVVQVFDVHSRAILRTLRGHDDAVRVTQFLPNRVHLLTASDDKTVRVWDMTAEKEVCLFEDFQDYVRAGSVSVENPNVVLAGGYDQTVRLFDVRANKNVLTMQHGAGVEAVQFFRNDGWIASAGGNQLKIWDIVSGGKTIVSTSNHQKTITCMTLDGSGTRLLTGSLDHHVKVYDVNQFKVIHSIKYPAPVKCLDVSPKDTHLVVGMTNGALSIREKALVDQQEENEEKLDIKSNTFDYFLRGLNENPEQTELQVKRRRGPKMTRYDKYLRSFEYGKALDEVLTKKQNPITVISLLDELNYRSGLVYALGGRDDVGLEPMIRFIFKYVNHPRCAKLLMHVMNVILDLYGQYIAQSPLIDELVNKIKIKIGQELETQQRVMATLGMMDALFATSTLGTKQ